MTAPERPVLRYFGGKWRLAPWVISHFPPHEIYVEPFGGAASVLMRKQRAKAEVYNDLDENTVNVFRVLRDPKSARRLLRLLRKTPFSRSELQLAMAQVDDPIERARRTIVRAFQGFASQPGVDRPGFRCATAVQNTTAAADWISYAKALPAFTERLAGVTIECTDGLELIGRYDSDNTLYYLDPPYAPETRRSEEDYRHEMSESDHARMLEAIRKLKGMVLISGYQSQAYADLGWANVEVEHYANGTNSEKRKRTEVLWMNSACVAAQSQMRLL